MSASEKWMEVTHGMSGWFAVIVHINTTDIPGTPFPEPYQSGIGRYETRAEAVQEAIQWAKDEGLELRCEVLT